MLPIVDKPLIQYAVEEAVEAGITDLIFVTGRSKRAIEDHFDKAYELESELAKRAKKETLAQVQDMLPRSVNCVFIRQGEALGLGHAVLCAEPVVGNEPFALILADDLISGSPGMIKRMVDTHAYHKCSVIAVEEVSPTETKNYGIVDANAIGNGLSQVNGIVEKPAPENAPSNIAVVGRYLLTPRIFQYLRDLPRGSGGEYQLTDAIAELIKSERVLAQVLTGRRFDCGSKIGYLEATLDYALRHPEVSAEFRDMLLAYAGRIHDLDAERHRPAA
jgi:UTP--glucose-1-phosphate uridylyltransferase